MVWPFKKQKDVVDLTYLAKRGLIKVPKQEEYKNISNIPVSTSSEADSSLGFLGALAESAEPSPKETSNKVTPNRIDDIEYKLESISKRVNAMMDRLDLAEKKIERDSRKSG